MGLLCGLSAGCQVYLNGGPGSGSERTPPYDEHAAPHASPHADPHASVPVHAPVPRPSTLPAAPPDDLTADPAAPAPAPPAAVAPATEATVTSGAAPPRRGGATSPGERYYAAGRTWIVLDAVEDALEGADFHVLSSGTSTRGGEVHAERRQRLGSPRTSTSPVWAVQAAVIRIAGSTWEDCCYVKATFTTTRLNSRGDVLGTTATDEPENQVLRSWFFDDVAARVPPEPAY